MNIATVALPFLRACSEALSPRGCLFTFHRGASVDRWRSLPNRDFYLNLEFLDNLLAYLADSGWDIVTLDEATERVKPGRSKSTRLNSSHVKRSRMPSSA